MITDNLFLWLFLASTFAAAIPTAKQTWNKVVCFAATVIFTILGVAAIVLTARQ
jgi:Na+/glutamate symporter